MKTFFPTSFFKSNWWSSMNVDCLNHKSIDFGFWNQWFFFSLFVTNTRLNVIRNFFFLSFQEISRKFFFFFVQIKDWRKEETFFLGSIIFWLLTMTMNIVGGKNNFAKAKKKLFPFKFFIQKQSNEKSHFFLQLNLNDCQ